MTFLLAFEIVGILVAVSVLAAVVLVAACEHWYGTLPLLDGRPLLSALDEHAHERLTVQARLAEDQQVQMLDALWDLPARGHR